MLADPPDQLLAEGDIITGPHRGDLRKDRIKHRKPNRNSSDINPPDLLQGICGTAGYLLPSGIHVTITS